MVEINNDFSQNLGHLPDTNGQKTVATSQSRLPATVRLPKKNSSLEQTSFVDERIKNEIPNLRIVKKGKAVLVETEKGGFTRVFLKENAILQIFIQRDHPKRLVYLLRAPVTVQSASNMSIIWQPSQGKRISAFSKQRKIPMYLVPEVMGKLRPYTKIA